MKKIIVNANIVTIINYNNEKCKLYNKTTIQKRKEKSMIKKNWKTILIIMIVIIISACAVVYADYVLNATEVKYTKADNSEISVKSALDDLYTKAPKYKTGDIVKLKNDTSGDKFYVLYENKDTMEIFAYTNIDRDTCNKQVKLAYGSTSCAFSSTQYWGSTAGLNLNNVTGYAAGDAMDKVNIYANAKGAISGRLLTKSEVENLTGVTGTNRWNTIANTKIRNMIDGVGNTANTGSTTTTNGHFEYYWLASGIENNVRGVWFVHGGGSVSDSGDFIGNNIYGVRPVLNVYKSGVESAS